MVGMCQKTHRIFPGRSLGTCQANLHPIQPIRDPWTVDGDGGERREPVEPLGYRWDHVWAYCHVFFGYYMDT